VQIRAIRGKKTKNNVPLQKIKSNICNEKNPIEIIKLVVPSKEHKNAAIAYRQEHFDFGEDIINGSALFDKIDSYEEWLLYIKKISNKETVQPDWVVSSVFFGIRESDNKIIGIIDIRHYLNDLLSKYYGHIGYSVRPSERQKGYATQILSLAIDYCKNLKLKRIMLGCYSDNIASIKTITKCKGILERDFLYLDGKPMSVFWVELFNKS
jgi:predicted acetyltransferase